MRQRSTRNDAPRPLNRLEVTQALRVSVWHGVFAMMAITFAGGVVPTAFALYLGAGSVLIALITAIGQWSGLMQLVSSYWAEQVRSRKRLVLWFGALSVVVALPVIFVPTVVPPPLRIGVYLTCLLLSSLLGTITGPAWTAWISDLVPASHRGRFFGYRNLLLGIVGTALSLPVALFLDMARKHQMFPEGIAYTVLFSLSITFNIVGLVVLSRQAEPPRMHDPAEPEQEGSRRQGWRKVISYYRQPVTDTAFRPLLLALAAVLVSQTFAGPFFPVYQIKELKFDLTWIQIIAIVASSAALAVMAGWGYLCDRYGNRPVITLCMIGASISPVVWFFTSPAWSKATNIGMIMAADLLSGLFWAGVGLAQFNLMVGLAPANRRALYVSTATAAMGIAGGLAPVLGGWTMEALSGLQLRVGGWTLQNYQVMFLSATLLRLLTAWLFRFVQEPESKTTMYLVGHLTSSRPIASLKAIHGLRKAGDSERRLQAVEQLAGIRSPLAVQELQQALDDPVPEVRRQAAEVLGEIRDNASVAPLAAKLRDEGSGVGPEAARALGRIGVPEAVPPLIEALHHPLRTVRISAAKALGQIGNASAVPALGEAALASTDVTLIRTAVEAAGQLGSATALEWLAPLLDHPDREVRTAVGEAIARIGDRRAAPELIRRLPHEESQTVVAAYAEALGALGDPAALNVLLQALDAAASGTTLRQIVAAIARILGGGDRVYALMTQEPFARDQSISRLLEGVAKKWKHQPQTAQLVNEALDKYSEGQFGEVIRIARALIALQDRSDEVLDYLNTRAGEREMRIEETLLALTRLTG